MQTTRSTEVRRKKEGCKARHKRIKEDNKIRIIALKGIIHNPESTKEQRGRAQVLLDKLRDHVTRKLTILENGAAPPPGENK